MVKVVKIWAPWCAPCRAYTIHFEEARNQLGLMFPDIEWTEWNADVVDISKYEVGVIPTTLILLNDEVIGKKSGVLDTGQLIEFITTTLQENPTQIEKNEVLYGSN